MADVERCLNTFQSMDYNNGQCLLIEKNIHLNGGLESRQKVKIRLNLA